VINDENVLAKINLAKKLNRQIDGHTPGLKEKSEEYISYGIY